MPRAKKSKNGTAKPAGGLKRGRVGPEESAKIKEAAAGGASVGDLSSQFLRSEKVVQAVINGTAGSSKKAAKAPKGKRGRPKKDASAAVAPSKNGLNLRQIIADVVAQEVKKQLQQAFQ